MRVVPALTPCTRSHLLCQRRVLGCGAGVVEGPTPEHRLRAQRERVHPVAVALEDADLHAGDGPHTRTHARARVGGLGAGLTEGPGRGEAGQLGGQPVSRWRALVVGLSGWRLALHRLQPVPVKQQQRCDGVRGAQRRLGAGAAEQGMQCVWVRGHLAQGLSCRPRRPAVCKTRGLWLGCCKCGLQSPGCATRHALDGLQAMAGCQVQRSSADPAHGYSFLSKDLPDLVLHTPVSGRQQRTSRHQSRNVEQVRV